jgi:hypothetical protein
MSRRPKARPHHPPMINRMIKQVPQARRAEVEYARQRGGRPARWFPAPVGGQSIEMRFGNVEVQPLGGRLGCLFMVLFPVLAAVLAEALGRWRGRAFESPPISGSRRQSRSGWRSCGWMRLRTVSRPELVLAVLCHVTCWPRTASRRVTVWRVARLRGRLGDAARPGRSGGVATVVADWPRRRPLRAGRSAGPAAP